MEFEKNYEGIAKAGLTTGIIGTALGALGADGGIGNILGGGKEHSVNRYEFGMQMECEKELQKKNAEIARLETEVKFRDANIYSDQKSLELYRYIDSQIGAINQQLSAQAVQNQANKDTFQILQERLDCAKKECCEAIHAEKVARQCADNTIVNYANNTFYPKLVASVTAGTETTPQAVYNPLPACECNC